MRGPELLTQWREARSMNQSQAAKMAGVSQSIWSDWEKGKKTPKIDTAVMIERLTDGAVPLRSWAEEPEQPAAE